MALTDYTTYAEVRAVLGVSNKDISDATLGLPIYVSRLEESMLGVHENLLDKYTLLKAQDSTTTPYTKLETRFLNAVQVYAAYQVGAILLASAQMFSLKRVTDGRAEGERFSDPFALLREDVNTVLADLKTSLQDLLGKLGEQVEARRSRTMFATSSRGSDPVVGG